MRLPGVVAALILLAACAAPPRPAPEAPKAEAPRAKAVTPQRRAVQPISGRALVVRLLPPGVAGASGWADDIHLALAQLGIDPHAQNVCAAVAIIEQESDFRVDPVVPGLSGIARRELERRRRNAHIPGLLVRGALALRSSDGRSYGERLDRVRTEGELSELYEDFARRMPLPVAFFAEQNPVRTGGPMQVSVRFAEGHAAARAYPFGPYRSIRDEVFTRRGGLYFGIAHLLGYAAPYDDPVYRFADHNAGRYASRNAAFQKALSALAGVPLELDGDLHARTAAAALKLAPRLALSAKDIQRDLAFGATAQFEQTALYTRVFALAGDAPRAVLPQIALRTAKTRRMLTTDGFALRAAERYRACLARL